jgi:hypothetical protein
MAVTRIVVTFTIAAGGWRRLFGRISRAHANADVVDSGASLIPNLGRQYRIQRSHRSYDRHGSARFGRAGNGTHVSERYVGARYRLVEDSIRAECKANYPTSRSNLQSYARAARNVVKQIRQNAKSLGERHAYKAS